MVVVRGVPFMWRDVRRGLAVVAGGEGVMWCKYIVPDGPEESMSGRLEWNDNDVTADCESC